MTSFAGCGGGDPAPNIVLISLDTLRADALEVYGYERPTSPRLREFAEDAYVFHNAYTHSANTITSHASILTGLHPATHGTRSDRPLSETFETLSESLQRVGYRTAGFTTHADWLNREKGFAQGFDRFESRFRSADRNNEAALDWLDSFRLRIARFRAEPFFLFLHYYDIHSDWKALPYESDEGYRRRFAADDLDGFSGCRSNLCASTLLRKSNFDTDLISAAELEWIRGLYDGGVAQMDQRLGELFDALDRRGLFDSSWVVVTSDHGEEFREHGKMLHSQPYRETGRVPLLIRPPGGAPRLDIDAVVGLVDIMPTLLQISGGRVPEQVQGESLVATLQGDPRGDLDDDLLGEEAAGRSVFFDFYHKPDAIAVRDARYTLITDLDTGEVELYDWRTDIAERENVADAHRDVVDRLRERAIAFRADQQRAGPAKAQPVSISTDERERLRALGYVE